MNEQHAQAVTDTLKHAAESGNDNSWIMHHILDGNYLDFTFFKIYLPAFDLFGYHVQITRHIFFLWVVAFLVFFALKAVANRYKKSLVPTGFGNLVELLVVFVRDEIAKPTIGKGYEKFLPYLLTAFFFILFSNFLGLIPFTATVTSNISVTATLATISFITIQAGGIKKNGLFGYFKGLIPHGIPTSLLPIMVIVEFLGLFTKPFALAVRLFANMTAGHIVIYALISLIFVMQSFAIAPVSVGMALFVYMLEILVALLQAYIFTMLSSLFIGMAVHQDH